MTFTLSEEDKGVNTSNYELAIIYIVVWTSAAICTAWPVFDSLGLNSISAFLAA